MVPSPANSRLRVVRVVYSRPRVFSLLLLLSGGVVGSSASFCALGICELNWAMGGGCASKTLRRALRFMLATLARVASGREELDGEALLPAWTGVTLGTRSTGLSDRIWGEKRLTRGGLESVESSASGTRVHEET